MELNQLLQFKTIAECTTMIQAAKQLGVSQPALSTALKKLEEELGVQLFERKKNRMTISEAGGLVLKHVNLILEQTEQMKAEMHQYAHRDNVFSIAFCDPGPLWYCLPRFSMIHPEVEVRSGSYEEAEYEEAYLLDSVYDILISSKKLEHPDIVSKPFLEEQLMISIPRVDAASTRETISLRSLRSRTITQFATGGCFMKQQEAFWKSLEPEVYLTSCDEYFVFNQTMQNTGAWGLSSRLIRNYRNDGPERVLIPVSDEEAAMEYHISYRKEQEQRLEPFLAWAEYCAAEFVKI